ncbi:MAG: hypothetical protein HC929_06655 [Leptolyngbyaceae cyanobacterium SM2_5_2]|nr:hypothetical protein [Leptolyngbyaceae cyanobacterium SM2_5_2]
MNHLVIAHQVVIAVAAADGICTQGIGLGGCTVVVIALEFQVLQVNAELLTIANQPINLQIERGVASTERSNLGNAIADDGVASTATAESIVAR